MRPCEGVCEGRRLCCKGERPFCGLSGKRSVVCDELFVLRQLLVRFDLTLLERNFWMRSTWRHTLLALPRQAGRPPEGCESSLALSAPSFRSHHTSSTPLQSHSSPR